MNALNRLSATSAASKLASREITAQALLQACLDRIHEREPTVHAWTFLDADGAMRRARALDGQVPSGLLYGLPIGVKDIFDTCDMPTGYGSPIYANHRPAADAATVALVRAAGGIVLGKTVTTEFATFHPGPTRNPHNPGHTPGGSSSGSAAAVADWMVPLAFATQTAGSIVRPAAFCGIVGYKPTFGLVPRPGVKMTSDYLDTVGAHARSVPDAALFVAALSGRHELLIHASTGDIPRIGMCRTYEWSRAQPETVAVFELSAKRLRAAGADVQDVTLPPPFAGLVEAQLAIMLQEIAKSLSHEHLAHQTGLSAELTKMIDAGLKVSPEQYDAARSLTRICRAMLPQVFKKFDVLLAPSSLGEAPAGMATGDPLFNRMWTLLHGPVVHVPVGHGPHGLPLGVTVVGDVGSDRVTLRAADWIHARLGE